VLYQDTKHDKRGQRCINEAIGFRIPDEKIKDKAKQYKNNGKPIHRKERTINSDFDIIAQYQSEFRRFAQYYLLAYDAHQLHGLKRTMELSLAYPCESLLQKEIKLCANGFYLNSLHYFKTYFAITV